MSHFFGQSNASDPLTTRLREEARSFDPTPPADMHRRIVSALAAADVPRAADPHKPAWWWFAAGTIAAAACVAVLLLRDWPGSAKAPHAPDRVVIGDMRTTYPSPLTLALRYVDDPLEGEMQNLLNDLSRASTTVTHVFPGTAKRQKPTTQGPAGAAGV